MVFRKNSTGLPSQGPALPEGIRYYIVRESDKSMVPLVPADQLPFRIQGIPPQLNHEQMSKEQWKWIAETAEVKCQLAVQAPARHLVSAPSSPSTPYLAPDHHVKTELRDRTAAPNMNGAEVLHSSASHPSKKVPAALELDNPNTGTDAGSLTVSIPRVHPQEMNRSGYSPQFPPPSGIIPDPSKKKYCTHWIKTGECAFMAQGCLYKHEIPSPEMLKKLGLHKPLWIKEKEAQMRRGPTWMQTRAREQKEEEEDDLEYRGAPSSKEGRFRGLFEKISKEPNHDAPEHDKAPPRRAASEERDSDSVLPYHRHPHVYNLIDLEPPTPAPSRSASVIPTTTESECESDSSSILDSKHTSTAMRSTASVSRTNSPGTRNSMPEGTSLSTQDDRRPVIVRRGNSASNHPAQRLTERKAANTQRRKATREFGLASSRYAGPSTKPIHDRSSPITIEEERRAVGDMAPRKKNVMSNTDRARYIKKHAARLAVRGREVSPP